MGEKLGIFIAEQDNCPYIQGQFRLAIALSPVDCNDTPLQYPINPILQKLQHTLIPKGFHQGHLSVAFNNCLYCKACVPLRINVKDYPFTKTDQRITKELSGLQTKLGRPQFYAEHFDLYKRYMAARYPAQAELFSDFSAFEKTMSRHHGMVENRNAQKQLVSVTLYDVVENGTAGFSIFYDPAQSKASLGTYAYLQMITITQALGLDNFYIGNWVKDGKSVDYKQRYKNLEAMTAAGWVPFDAQKTTRGPDLLPSLPTDIERKIIQLKPVA